MAELIPCKHCGGKPEYFFEWTETAFGDRRFVGVRCSQCLSETAAYMCGDRTVNQDLYETIDSLWNRGCINDNRLKPCPFCGSNAEIVENGVNYEVHCSECSCRIGRGHGIKKYVIAAWNGRA